MERLELRLVGAVPLLMHSSRLADPTDEATIEIARLTSKRKKSASDHEWIAKLEWMAGLWLDKGQPCLPPEAVVACLIDAARTRRLGKIVAAGVTCPAPARLEHEGAQDLEALWADPRFRLRKLVRVANGRVFRTRPRFPQWSAKIEIDFLPELISGDLLRDLYEVAGYRIGLGDFRPRFGRFHVL